MTTETVGMLLRHPGARRWCRLFHRESAFAGPTFATNTPTQNASPLSPAALRTGLVCAQQRGGNKGEQRQSGRGRYKNGARIDLCVRQASVLGEEHTDSFTAHYGSK